MKAKTAAAVAALLMNYVMATDTIISCCLRYGPREKRNSWKLIWIR